MRLALAMLALAVSATGVLADPPPLIPRDVLFGNPEKAGSRISPDGKHIAYLAPDDKNVMQVWVRSTVYQGGKPDDASVTQDPKRGISQYFWPYDGKHLLYLQDAGGDENYHLYAVDLATRKTRDLTPFKGIRVQGVDLDKHFPNEILIGLNKRNPALFDMHRVSLDTGEMKLDTENPGGAVGFTSDAKFQVRGCTIAKPTGGFELKVKGDDGKWTTIKEIGPDDQGQLAAFGTDPNTAWLIHNSGANAMRLLKMDVKTSKEEVVAEDAEYDVSGAIIDEDKRIPLAVSFTKARTEWKVLDDSIKEDFAVLAKVRRGDFVIGSRTNDNMTWLVSYVTDDGPSAAYLYDRKAKKAELLYVSNSKLQKVQLAPMEPIEFDSRDGLKIRGYLTKPLGVPAKNLPTVLLVHGGPWARDSWGYSPLVQHLANRGYAVLQVNFRGSTGYGKKFLNAGNKEWAGKMHDDLLDGVEWITKQGIADPKKIAIMGGSYGGYATLVGLAFTPNVFACGVDIVGPSNIVTLLKTVPPYWAPMKAMFTKRVGDLEKDADFLEQRSPLYRADQITKPLLIGQGANDPRVKQAESDQIVAAMRKNKQAVEYVVYPDEGHGFVRPENRLHFFAVTEAFLSKHLGGRAEPIGEIKGHSGVTK
jgi:dipeptidyl aminopeptidase/acylaminoacyl peptidase